MNLIYDFNLDSVEDLMQILSRESSKKKIRKEHIPCHAFPIKRSTGTYYCKI